MDNSLELLHLAAASSLGIIIEVSSFDLARQRLYQARTKAADPELNKLQFRRSPHGEANQIWIVKGGNPSAKD